MNSVTSISQQFVSKLHDEMDLPILGEGIIEDEVSTTKDQKFIAKG